MNPSYIKFSLMKTINSMQRDPAPYVKNADSDFSRKRKILFSDLILNIISMENHLLNRELRRFFPSDKKKMPTKSAFIFWPATVLMSTSLQNLGILKPTSLPTPPVSDTTRCT